MTEKEMKIIKVIGKIPFIKPLLRYTFKDKFNKYVSVNELKSKESFRNYALEALSKFDECMKENNYFYTLAFGSILGAIREKGFIKHDLDIDVYMWIEDFNSNIIKELKKYGFTWYSNYLVDNGKLGREDTFEYKGAHIDIFYIYPKMDKYPYCCDFVQDKNLKKNKRLPRRIEFPIIKERKLVDFENLKLYVPSNAEEICQFRYGPNFMIPDPSWDWVNAKESIVEWREMIKHTKVQYNPKKL